MTVPFPGYADPVDVQTLRQAVESLIDAKVQAAVDAISNELIPQRVSDLAAARPRRILTRAQSGSVSANNGVRVSGWVTAAGDGGNGSGITYANGVITVAQSGVYEIEFSVSAGGTSAAHVVATLRDGSPGGIVATEADRAATQFVTLTGAVRVSLSAADELDIYLFSSAAASNIGPGRWTIEKVA